jgi:phosphoribosyl 1,2-cyclic phosphodiesterase
MNVHFCVLGSGSEGNAALLMAPHVHVLIDAGFFPDELAARMDGTGASWDTIDAVVLTHTHGDHIKKKCLTFCAKHDVRFICHERHAEHLSGGRYFKRVVEKGLLQTYNGDGPFEVGAHVPENSAPTTKLEALRFFPIPLPHDAPPTFGFRIEARLSEPAERWVKIGYLADLGVGHEPIAREVMDVDLLALEFNHDVELERRSGRHPTLIQRVLGKDGHLSNDQAAELFRTVLENGTNGGPKLLVQMHLSRDCNRPELAYKAAQEVVLLTGAATRVFSTRQDRRGTVHCL